MACRGCSPKQRGNRLSYRIESIDDPLIIVTLRSGIVNRHREYRKSRYNRAITRVCVNVVAVVAETRNAKTARVARFVVSNLPANHS